MTNDLLKKYVRNLPDAPGIYIFKDANKKDIYIGKATRLKNRVTSYLKTGDPRIKKMVQSAEGLNFIETGSEIEALILESRMIKKYRPSFNVVMRDDKQYFYVGFTKDEFPKIFWTHQPHNPNFKGVDFIGPFTDGGALKSALGFLRRIFPYCTCKGKPHNNFCLNYHIGKCLGYCCLKNSGSPEREMVKEAYLENISAIKYIFDGKKQTLLKKLEKEMDLLAKRGDLESAIELREKASNLKRIFENARLIKNSEILRAYRSGLEPVLKIRKPIIRIEGYDISNIQGSHATGSMVTFVYGKPDKNFYRKFKIYTRNTPDDTGMLREVLQRRFRHEEWPFPDLILIDGGKGQVNLAIKTLKGLGVKIPVIGISKNERHLGHQIIIPGKKNPVSLEKLSSSDKNLLLAVDSEAHRFAIGYYRHLHRKNFK